HRVDEHVRELGLLRAPREARPQVEEMRVGEELQPEQRPEKQAEAAVDAVNADHDVAPRERRRADQVVRPDYPVAPFVIHPPCLSPYPLDFPLKKISLATPPRV